MTSGRAKTGKEQAQTEQPERTVYEIVGGQPFFEELVKRFYEHVENSEVLRPLYPEALDGPRARLTEFLMQYWGGPPVYSGRRGHPRLRMRHAEFAISVYEHDAWLDCMRSALNAVEMPDAVRTGMIKYFESAAALLINRTRPSPGHGKNTSPTTIPLSC